MHSFVATIELLGINPFVFVPDDILQAIFTAAGKDKGPIPVHGHANGTPYRQTLVRYKGAWRLYINTTMLKDSPKHIGEQLQLTIAYDPADRRLPIHPALGAALAADPPAKAVFASLTPSLQLEINRYISNLKTEQAVIVNTRRAIRFLNGEGTFVGRKSI